MTTQFRRTSRLRIRQDFGSAPSPKGLDLSNLDVEFDIKKAATPLKPNSCELKIYNLTKEHRQYLEAGRNRLIFEAGYNDENVQLFNGQTRYAWSEWQDSGDWITTLQTGDGIMPMALAQINTNLGKSASFADALRASGNSMGVKLGNLEEIISKLSDKLTKTMSKRGVIFGGTAANMQNICDSAGLDWTIQDGELLFTEKGQPLDAPGVLLTPNTGLVGSPTLEAKGAGSFTDQVAVAKSIALSKPGFIVNATSLLNGALRVCGRVRIEAEDVKGTYKILEVNHIGQTRGSDWYTKLVGQHFFSKKDFI